VRLGAVLTLAGTLALASPMAGQGAEWTRTHYLKREAMVPMRDGAKLYTAIYTPREAAGPLPFLMNRTPYGNGPYGPEAYPEHPGPSEALARDGFIFVRQDVRGRMMSEGEFIEDTPHLDGLGVDEATDAYDTIQWLLANVPGNNARVGVWGISYPGYYAASTLVGSHPALKAVSPQAPMVDLFEGDDDHHNGALFLSQGFWFYASFGRARTGPGPVLSWDPGFLPAHADGYRFFLELGALPHADERYLHGTVRSWLDEMEHGTKDAYWQSRDLRPHIKAPAPAVLLVGGWFDAEDLFGPLALHRILTPREDRTLVMGPWSHGGWSHGTGHRLGDVDFGSDTSAYFQANLERPFFLHHLKGAENPALPAAAVFETGRNRWHALPAWPPPSAKPVPLYLGKGGALAFEAPRDPEGADRFTSDPAHPVPYTPRTELRVGGDFMTGDQRFAATRPDVLTYRTAPLERDLTLAGPIQVRLQVSTTGTDADWVVKVIDVYPDDFGAAGLPPATDWEPPVNLLGGYQQLLRGDVMRGKFRSSFENPSPFVPGRPTAVGFTLNDVCHTFLKGHRLMVQIQSSWFPLVDRNPQVFEDIYKAKDEDFHAAEHTVYRNSSLPSCLMLPVVEALPDLK